MGFLLYRLDKTECATTCTRVGALSLARPQGALARFLQAHAAEPLPWAWDLSGPMLISTLAPAADPSGHILVMDMDPGQFLGASLCQVVRIVGSSDADETDLVLVMHEVLREPQVKAAAELKASFPMPAAPLGPEMLESVGLAGGTRRGSYRWCSPKMNIGATIIGNHAASRAII